MASDTSPLNENVSSSFDSANFSADEDIIQQRGKKRKFESLQSPRIQHSQEQTQDSVPSKFERRRSILRTPIKKRLKLMHNSKKKESLKKRLRTC